MTPSPTERREILQMIAEMVVKEIREEAGGNFSNLMVLPLATCSQLLGLSTEHIRKKLPVTTTATGKWGMTVASISRHIESNTKAPA